MDRKRKILRRVGGWLALAAFAWSAHAQASTKQVKARPANPAVRPISMQDCQPCAACYQGPAPAIHAVGANDEPAMTPPTWITPLDDAGGSLESVSDTTARTALALRVLYCRWLN